MVAPPPCSAAAARRSDVAGRSRSSRLRVRRRRATSSRRLQVGAVSRAALYVLWEELLSFGVAPTPPSPPCWPTPPEAGAVCRERFCGPLKAHRPLSASHWTVMNTDSLAGLTPGSGARHPLTASASEPARLALAPPRRPTIAPFACVRSPILPEALRELRAWQPHGAYRARSIGGSNPHSAS